MALMIHLDGKHLSPLSFKLYPDTKVFRMFIKFAKYNELDLIDFTFLYKGVPIEDYEITVQALGCKDDDEIRAIREYHTRTKIKFL